MNHLNFVLLDASNARWIFGDLFKALIWISLFAAIYFAIYYYLQLRNKERMAMIERGNDLSELYNHKPTRTFYFPWFKLISTIMGIGIGGLSAFFIIPTIEQNHFDKSPLIFLSILIFGAIGMLVGHFMDLNMQKKLKQQK